MERKRPFSAMIAIAVSLACGCDTDIWIDVDVFPPTKEPCKMANYSATLGHPSTEWGVLVFDGTNYLTQTSGSTILVGSDIIVDVQDHRWRLWARFDISNHATADTVRVNTLKLRFKTGSLVTSEPVHVRGISVDPHEASAADIWAAFGETDYEASALVLDTQSEETTVLIPGAADDLNAAIAAGQSWFAIGLQMNETEAGQLIDSIDKTAGLVLQYGYLLCDDPFSRVDDDVHLSLAEYAGLTALVHPDRIIAPSRSVNLDDMEGLADTHPKLVVLPDFSPFDLHAGSANLAELRLRYQIAILTNDAQGCRIRNVEWQVFRALMNFKNRKRGDTTTDLENPSPLNYLCPMFSIARLGCEWHGDLDPARWKGLFEFDVVISAESASILA